jgi:hypothetical protein
MSMARELRSHLLGAQPEQANQHRQFCSAVSERGNTDTGAVFPLSAAHDGPDASACRERLHGHVP